MRYAVNHPFYQYSCARNSAYGEKVPAYVKNAVKHQVNAAINSEYFEHAFYLTIHLPVPRRVPIGKNPLIGAHVPNRWRNRADPAALRTGATGDGVIPSKASVAAAPRSRRAPSSRPLMKPSSEAKEAPPGGASRMSGGPGRLALAPRTPASITTPICQPRRIQPLRRPRDAGQEMQGRSCRKEPTSAPS